MSHAFTFAANLSEHKVSFAHLASGETFTNIRVFESPPRQGCIKESPSSTYHDILSLSEISEVFFFPWIDLYGIFI